MYLPCAYTKTKGIKYTNVFMGDDDSVADTRILREGLLSLKNILKEESSKEMHYRLFELCLERLESTEKEADVRYNFVNAYTLSFDVRSKRLKNLKIDYNGLGKREFGSYTASMWRKLRKAGEWEEAEELHLMESLRNKTCNGIAIGTHIYDEKLGALILDEESEDYQYIPVLIECIHYNEFNQKLYSTFPSHILTVCDKIYICPIVSDDSIVYELARIASVSTDKVTQERLDSCSGFDYPLTSKEEFNKIVMGQSLAHSQLRKLYKNQESKVATMRVYRAIMQNYMYLESRSGTDMAVPMYNFAPVLHRTVAVETKQQATWDWEQAKTCSVVFKGRGERLRAEWKEYTEKLSDTLEILEATTTESFVKYTQKLMTCTSYSYLWETTLEMDWLKTSYNKLKGKLPPNGESVNLSTTTDVDYYAYTGNTGDSQVHNFSLLDKEGVVKVRVGPQINMEILTYGALKAINAEITEGYGTPFEELKQFTAKRDSNRVYQDTSEDLGLKSSLNSLDFINLSGLRVEKASMDICKEKQYTFRVDGDTEFSEKVLYNFKSATHQYLSDTFSTISLVVGRGVQAKTLKGLLTEIHSLKKSRVVLYFPMKEWEDKEQFSEMLRMINRLSSSKLMHKAVIELKFMTDYRFNRKSNTEWNFRYLAGLQLFFYGKVPTVFEFCMTDGVKGKLFEETENRLIEEYLWNPLSITELANGKASALCTLESKGTNLQAKGKDGEFLITLGDRQLKVTVLEGLYRSGLAEKFENKLTFRLLGSGTGLYHRTQTYLSQLMKEFDSSNMSVRQQSALYLTLRGLAKRAGDKLLKMNSITLPISISLSEKEKTLMNSLLG